MIATIGPLVQGERRQWWRSTALHVLGSVTGGAAFFGTIAVLGWLALRYVSPEVRWLATGIVVGALAMAEFGILRFPLPTLYRSVPKSWWINLGPNRGALAYGLVLGMGITTVIPFGTFYALALAALLFADPVYGLALGATYGIARAVPVLVASGAIAAHAEREENPHESALTVTTRVLAWRGPTSTANGVAEAGFGAIAIASGILASWP